MGWIRFVSRRVCKHGKVILLLISKVLLGLIFGYQGFSVIIMASSSTSKKRKSKVAFDNENFVSEEA